ncbi:Predicted protein [Taphrina deformans PYCC 5710]|uniref:Uncharacterized protein n=1 Tax=Taphrina deformans (strain PYCC 5710 / ATCC 11124 / CBS 356.35 / IMI 108563 / JCM 9778 / NBRC 8474) TaxID=1097556 RepID=R4X8E0_TAPDE|nr:Predicted protein [Taphrina deformans PYCC 5710]|eukprot:CCG81849.1 Predicted protein [Taphrina deformans PYCC 5710]
MGASSSKNVTPEEGHIFRNSTVPVSFSAPLVQRLEESTISETDRQLMIESLVQERVAQELQKLRNSESEAFANTTYDLSKQNIAAETNSDLNSVILEADVQELKRKLKRSSQYSELTGTKLVDTTQSKVVQCLREKKDRSLDCKAEVDAFKASVRELQKEFSAKYH